MTSRETARIIDELTGAERLQLAMDLWDSVSDDADAWELTPAQRKELDRRVKAYRKRKTNGEPAGLTWAQAKRRILAQRK